jgi:hypothetical protein
VMYSLETAGIGVMYSLETAGESDGTH